MVEAKNKTNSGVSITSAFEQDNAVTIGTAEVSEAADNLHRRFKETKQLSDIETANSFTDDLSNPKDLDAVDLHCETLALQPAPHSDRPRSLTDLATASLTQFHQTGQLSEVAEAVRLHREALALQPAPHPDRPNSLTNLATTLLRQFHQTGELSDVAEAVSLLHEALALRSAPHTDRPSSLTDLATALVTQFHQTGRLSDLKEAVCLHYEALMLFPALHPDRPGSLSNLATALVTQFKQMGQLSDLDEAVRLDREVLAMLPAPHRNRSAALNNLANILHERFNEMGQFCDLEEAVRLHREALALRPAPHPDRSMSLNNLGWILDTQYGQTGQLSDLEEAVQLHHEALSLLPAPNPHRSTSLNNLANILYLLFHETGRLLHLEEAVGLLREAFELLPIHEAHPDRFMLLNSLAGILCTRFDQTGQFSDLEEAVGLQRKVLALLPKPHPDRSMSLHNLASILHIQFGKTYQLSDLEEAIALHRGALALRPVPHPDRSSSLDNLADVLDTRFVQTDQLSDLEEAIRLHREALTLRSVPHPHRSATLHNLAARLGARFRQKHCFSDLEEALRFLSEALCILPQEHPMKCQISSTLGVRLLDMSSHCTQKSKYFNDAIDAFRAAAKCETAPVSARIRAARYWAYHADNTHDSALEAYQCAIGLLPRIATLGIDLWSRQKALMSHSDGLARNAAACAIRSGEFGVAVEFLEEGRNIFWSQALQLRSPLDELQVVASDLARKVQDISRALERGSFRDASTHLSDPGRRRSVEQETARCRALNEDWVATLAEVRCLDGFRDFLRPKALDTLQQATSRGPVVILNASDSRCDALIVTPSGVNHVPLPDMTSTAAKSLIGRVRIAISRRAIVPDATQKGLDQIDSTTSHSQGLADQHKDQVLGLPVSMKPNDEFQSVLEPDVVQHPQRPWVRPQLEGYATDDESVFRDVLAVLWMSIAEPIIRSLNLEKTESPPRLWWCPTGPFTSLPLHAAGSYQQDGNDCVSDYVVSSYIPTLNSLVTPPPLATPDFKTVNFRVEKYVKSNNLIKLGVGDAPASVEAVLSHLSDVSIAHFACHGEQNMGNPLESCLILDGGKKLKISQLMEAPMPKASLVFLSACDTAMGDENLPDEAIHIAASMLFAGFHGAIATLWSMSDEDGPHIADSFYCHLFQAGGEGGSHIPDTMQAARALHLAVKKLRDEGCAFKRWVPFIHLGL